jgi:hypothetical protein
MIHCDQIYPSREFSQFIFVSEVRKYIAFILKAMEHVLNVYAITVDRSALIAI